MRFSEKLRELRESIRIGQKDLGLAIGASGPTIHRWENGQGEPTLTQAIQLAAIFDVDVESLLDDSTRSVYTVKKLGDDERSIIDMYRKLNITEDDAIRAMVAFSSDSTGGLIWEVLSGLNKGGPEARELAFEIIAIGMERDRARNTDEVRSERYHEFPMRLMGEDVDLWIRAQNHVKWRFSRPWHREKDEDRWKAEEEHRRLEAGRRSEGITPLEPSKQHPHHTEHPRDLILDPADVEDDDAKK